MESPILDIRRPTISAASSRRHTFTPTPMRRVDDRRRYSQSRPTGHSDSSLSRVKSSRSGSSKGRNEDEITTPSGREITVPTRQVFTTGRGGVGNRSHSVESARQADASQTSLSHEKKVISQYKAKNAPTYRTGRGGAGAKGHVKALALVPNTEMVLAKERDIQYQWNLEKQMKGDIKTGRGGRGNILKGRPEYEGRGNSNSFDNSQIRVSSSRAESRRENVPPSREPRLTYGFGYAPTIRSRSSSVSEQPFYAEDNDILSMTAQEVDRASGIATPSVRPQQRSIPSSPILSTPATFTSFDLKREKDRIPNEVAPFEEPNRITPNKINRYQPAVHADKSAGKSDLTLFFKSFKHLRVGKTKDSKRTMRSDVIPDQLTIRSQRDSIIEVGANAFPSDHIIDIMRTPPPSAPATSQTIPSAYPYPYLDQMLMRTQSAGAFSDQYTLGEQLSRPDTAAESGSESSHRNSTSTSSVYSNPNYPTNTVALELTSQASREWFPQRRRNSFWRTRPLPNLPNAINSLHTRGSSNSSMPL